MSGTVDDTESTHPLIRSGHIGKHTDCHTYVHMHTYTQRNKHIQTHTAHFHKNTNMSSSKINISCTQYLGDTHTDELLPNTCAHTYKREDISPEAHKSTLTLVPCQQPVQPSPATCWGQDPALPCSFWAGLSIGPPSPRDTGGSSPRQRGTPPVRRHPLSSGLGGIAGVSLLLTDQ